MHWGLNYNGSEHSVDSKLYPGEVNKAFHLIYINNFQHCSFGIFVFVLNYFYQLHFVNWNSEKYLNSSEASQSNNHDGILVLAVFVEVKVLSFWNY